MLDVLATSRARRSRGIATYTSRTFAANTYTEQAFDLIAYLPVSSRSL